MPHAPRAIHAGERLAEERRGLNMSAAELARQRDDLNGQRSVTADTAGQGRKSGSTCNSSTNAAAPAKHSAHGSTNCRRSACALFSFSWCEPRSCPVPVE